MKETGDFQKTISITQYVGGYLIQGDPLTENGIVVSTFEEAILAIAQKFCLVIVGEKIKIESDI